MSTTLFRSARRAKSLGVIACASAVLSASALTLGASAAPAAPTPQAHAAIDWLGDQLDDHGGTMPGFGGSIDWGLTADAILAFAAADRGDDTAAQTAAGHLATNVQKYSTWDDQMPDANVRVAGATAKSLLALNSVGAGTTASGVDLEAELRSLMQTTGAQTGRFSDRVPDPNWDVANGFGQALSILALETTPGRTPAQAVQFLIAQQCPAGGFRLTYGTTAGCTSDADADTDTSAIALSALLAVDRTPTVSAALDKGAQWLLARQDAQGAFGGTGPTAAPNTNSTGMIAQFLRAAGFTAQADHAASWITGCCQVTSANASGTPLAVEAGAIAYNVSGFDMGRADGITEQMSDQWRRATAQAVLALGLAPYGRADVDPIDTTLPTIPTTSTTSTSTTTTTTAPGSTTTTTTTTSTTTVATTTTTTDTTTTSAAASTSTSTPTGNSAGTGSNNSNSGATGSGVLGDSATRSETTTTRRGLAVTGADSSTVIAFAFGLLSIGSFLTATGMRRASARGRS